MAVTKQTYTAIPTWTAAQLADLFRSAFIDAGLMTDWHDTFTNGVYAMRVLRIVHDNAKLFGSTYYVFGFSTTFAFVTLAADWNSGSDIPAGTQFIDWHVLPSAYSQSNPVNQTTFIQSSLVAATDVSLDRFTSATDTGQSWFVLRQGLNRSTPFSVLHQNTSLYPWIDLDKGIVNGYTTVGAVVTSNQGYLTFRLQENIRRCLLTGTALRGDVNVSGPGRYHAINLRTHCYAGLGLQSAQTANNFSSSENGGAVILPVGMNSANPGFSVNYVPIFSSLPWSLFTPTLLAADLGVYMHYADNTIAYGDKFIVQAGVNEWEVLQFANSPTVIDGASPTFLARVV